MFYGTTPDCIRSYFAAEVRRGRPKRVWDPCAGVFCISQVVGLVDKSIEVIAGDVSEYSSAIGYALAGVDRGIRLSPMVEDRFPAYRGMTDPTDVAACLVGLVDWLQNMHRSKARYYATLARHFELNHEAFFHAIRERLNRVRANLGRFTYEARDLFETIKGAQAGDWVWFDLPYWTGGYEKMFEGIESLADFSGVRVEYTQMTDERKLDAIREMLGRGVRVFWRPQDPVEVEGLELVFKFQYRPRKWYLVYASAADATRAQSRATLLPEKPVNYDTLTGDTALGPNDECAIVPLPPPVVTHYRLLWTRNVEMGRGVFSRTFGVFVGGKIVGVLAIVTGGSLAKDGRAFILSDVATPFSRYKRIGKLVLMATLTREFLKRLDDMTVWRHGGFQTTAFSRHPVSMKYRGLMELEDREDVKGGGYKLTYAVSDMPHDTIRDAYRAWYERHAAHARDENPGDGE